jgi:methylmalonyl-CoA/ethylmalonyl-CoA epimerase
METQSLIPPIEYFKTIVQIGVVVANVDEVAGKLTEIFGMGPFRVTDWPPEGREDMQRYYHQELANFTARMAFTELGPVELELIQPCEGNSIWSDYLREHGSGIHHIRFNVEAIEPVVGYLSQHGIEPAQHGTGLRPGTTWMNFDTEKLLGFIIEVMSVVPGTDGRTPKSFDGNG